VSTEDSNASGSLGDHNVAGGLTYPGYESWSATDSFKAGKLALGVAELEEREGNSAEGVH